MITIDPIKRPPKKSSSVDTTEIMKEVDLKITNLIDGAPETLDTIKELAEAVENIPNLDSFVTKEEINNIAAGIPVVEELDQDAPLGTVVCYKLEISEDIVKVIPFVKQENNWESLYITNSDFNNDFNFDFA